MRKKNVNTYNFTYQGCVIEFFERTDNADIDVIITKGNQRRNYQLTHTMKTEIRYDSLSGITYSCLVDCSEEVIEQFKNNVLKGRVELL